MQKHYTSEAGRIAVISLKKKLMSRRQNLKKDQGFHTMDFIEEKFEKKLDEMEKSISSKLENEFDAMI